MTMVYEPTPKELNIGVLQGAEDYDTIAKVVALLNAAGTTRRQQIWEARVPPQANWVVGYGDVAVPNSTGYFTWACTDSNAANTPAGLASGLVELWVENQNGTGSGYVLRQPAARLRRTGAIVAATTAESLLTNNREEAFPLPPRSRALRPYDRILMYYTKSSTDGSAFDSIAFNLPLLVID